MSRRLDPKVSVLSLALASMLFAACGGSSDGQRHCNDGESGNSLSGSYCEDIDMAFTEVRLLTVSSALRIEYVRPIGETTEKTLQIIIDESQRMLMPNVKIGLNEAGAQVRRIIADAQAPQDLTPELDNRSSITLTDFAGIVINEHISGRFDIIFKNSGRTLAGEFDGTIKDARPPMM